MSKKKNNTVRRSQSVSTYGVGSIMDLEDGSSVIICGLEKWSEKDCEPVTDYRLEKKLKTEIFRMAPDADFAKRPEQSIPAIRFPRWMYCGQCRFLRNIGVWRQKWAKVSHMDFDQNPACFKCKTHLIPSRFVVACSNGHLSDFPFDWWAHGGKPCQNSELQFIKTGTTSALSGLEIKCVCGAKETMQGAFNAEYFVQKSHCKCNGAKPWLGQFVGKCGLPLVTLQRGGSNVHFAVIKSSILIPPFSASKLHAEIKATSAFRMISTANALPLEDRVKMATLPIAQEIGKLPAEVEKALHEMLSQPEAKTDTTDEQYRYEEFRAFLERPDDSYDPKDFLIAEEPGYQIEGVERVVLAKKMREVRAQVGFTRISPSYGDDEVEEDEKAELVKVAEDERIRWLPAYDVRGEGIFIKFDQAKLTTWARSEMIATRYARVISKFKKGSVSRGVIEQLIPQFFLIHTFSHAVIRQLGFECGYSSTALKERLYCSSSSDTEMAGVLIYTAGDSEGTLGGLVKQGEKDFFESIVINAIKNIKWCSLDPLCIESAGQGFGARNLAACHACSMLFEASCETRNCYLDRAALVGTIANPELGFFTNWIEGRTLEK